MRRVHRLLLASALLAAPAADADELIMVRVSQTFPEAMASLQAAITGQGYTISRVQRVDVGLAKTGYKTAEYRVVFFGKPEEMRELPEREPELIPYLPLKITIFAERSDTLLVALDPRQLGDFIEDPELAPLFDRWARDLRAILERVRTEQ